MTYLSELVRQVMDSLLRNKLRSFLTMAGIAWGVSSIVLISAMGDGFKAGQRNNMKGLGVDIVILFGGRTELQAGGQRAGRRIHLNYSDVENIRRECWRVSKVAAELEGNTRATSTYNSGSFDISGVEAVFPELRTLPIGEGRFFTDAEEKAGRRLCIIGKDVKKQLFGARQGVTGSLISVNGLPFEVIGILTRTTVIPGWTKRGSFCLTPRWRAIFRLPLTTFPAISTKSSISLALSINTKRPSSR
jgi:putative ABC transport system permease protein